MIDFTARTTVCAAIARIRSRLPRAAEDPLVDKLDVANFPIVWICLSGADYGTLSFLADRVLKERLQADVSMAILVSALVSFTLTPLLSSRLLRHPASDPRGLESIERLFRALEERDRAALAWSVAHRGRVVAIATLSFAGGIALVPWIGIENVTRADKSSFVVLFDLPARTTVEQTGDRMREIERLVAAQPESHEVFALSGIDPMGGPGEIHEGVVFPELVPRNERAASQHESFLHPFTVMMSLPRALVGVFGMLLLTGVGLRP